MSEQKDITVAHAGAHGNPLLPGVPAAAPPTHFSPYPEITLRDGTRVIDKERVKQAFLSSIHDKWEPFCRANGYNPRAIALLPNDWVKEKKFKKSWAHIRDELDAQAAEIGPALLKQAVNAARKVPETLSSMLELLRFSLNEYHQQAGADQRKAAQLGRLLQPGEREFRATPGDLACLAGAITMTGQSLFKSLGIDDTRGIDIEKWNRTIEGATGKLDAIERGSDRAETIEVEVMGHASVKEAMREAMKWVDKPMKEVTPEPGSE